MAIFYASYIIIRCWLQPSLAPAYDVTLPPWSKRIISFLRYVLPLSSVFIVVMGSIFFGIATPSEASAFGVVACFTLAAIYKGLNWKVVKGSVTNTLRISGMVLLILAGAQTFSRILAFSGATIGLTEVVAGLPVSPLVVFISMQVLIFIWGCFMSPVTLLYIILPVYIPVLYAVGIDPIWFAVVTLLNLEMATTTPPFGLSLFVMKGVAPPDTTMGDVYRAGLPFIGCDLIVVVLLIAFPAIALWLPALMY